MSIETDEKIMREERQKLINEIMNIEIHSIRDESDELLRVRERYEKYRDKSNLDTDDPLYIPPEIHPPLGMIYRWGRYKVFDDIDYFNIDKLKKSGYKPVPIERHPELYSDGSVENTISRKGSVLMERTERSQEIFENRLKAVNEIMQGPDDFLAHSLAVRMIKHRPAYSECLTTVQDEVEVNSNTSNKLISQSKE